MRKNLKKFDKEILRLSVKYISMRIVLVFCVILPTGCHHNIDKSLDLNRIRKRNGLPLISRTSVLAGSTMEAAHGGHLLHRCLNSGEKMILNSTNTAMTCVTEVA